MILSVAGTDERVELSPQRLVVAGYTARDTDSVAAHIAELAAIGVPPPATVPAFYDLDPALLTSDAVADVGGPATSGEVEPVLIRRAGRYFLAVGSDHTDRELERTDIAAAKAACPKPVSGTVVDLGTDLSALQWDELTFESSVDGVEYQRGSGAILRHPAELFERMAETLGTVTGELVLFCGTFPLLDGGFVYGDSWHLRLRMPGGTSLSHSYEIKQRSR